MRQQKMLQMKGKVDELKIKISTVSNDIKSGISTPLSLATPHFN